MNPHLQWNKQDSLSDFVSIVELQIRSVGGISRSLFSEAGDN